MNAQTLSTSNYASSYDVECLLIFRVLATEDICFDTFCWQSDVASRAFLLMANTVLHC